MFDGGWMGRPTEDLWDVNGCARRVRREELYEVLPGNDARRCYHREDMRNVPE